jgi:xanthine dehydrogenase accessory factor
MKELFLLIRERLLSKESLVLVTVIESQGSTPRRAGARMLVGKGSGKTGKRLWGSTGGGISEHLAIEEAASLLHDDEARPQSPFSKRYLLHANEVADLGAVCGGEILVFFRLLDAAEPGLIEVIEKALTCFSQPNDAWFILGEQALGVAQEGCSLFSSGTGPEKLAQVLKSEPALYDESGKVWFVEPLVSSGFVYVFGGGHVAQELVPLLVHLGFRCVVFDDREDFASVELFPTAEKAILGKFENIGEYVTLSEKDYAVIITRGHLWDFDAWAFALSTKAAYIGVIGSKSKHKFIKEKLQARGFESKDIDAPRVHAPIGIDLKSDTPAEIAVSIAAELILARAMQRAS